ncbi:MAG: ABC transporter substrate-binding protein [Gammaproteobacteria bacterium]
MTDFSRRQQIARSQFRLCCLVCGLLMAVPADAAGSSGPAEMLSAMTEQVLQKIRSNPEILNDEGRTRSLAEKLILPNIDFRAASQWVLGKHWRTASPSQREAFTGEFRALLVNTYLRSLKKYRDNTVRILPARPGQPQGRAVVDAEVLQAEGPLIKVVFRLHQPKQNWLVYDIVIEGISLVATRRSEFSTEIRNKGLDSLIADLALVNASKATTAGETNP